VPPDGPCVTSQGAVVQLYDGAVGAFAVDDDFVYVASSSNIVRVPRAGGASTTYAAEDAGALPIDSFALSDRNIVLAPRAPALERIPVLDDPMTTSFGTSRAVGAFAFDGLAAFTTVPAMPNYVALARIPFDGSSPAQTTMPEGAVVYAIAPGADAVYVSVYGPPTQGILLKVVDGKDPMTLSRKVVPASPVAVDDAYVYFIEDNGSPPATGIARMALDGTGLTTLGTPAAGPLAVDAHALYFLGDGVQKMDKSGGAATHIAAFTPNGIPLVMVYGGNVYWAASGSDAGPGGLWTTCK
jgi:hypothetical protein